MSYTLLLIARRPGATPEAAVHAYLARPESEKGPGRFTPEVEARNRRLATLLHECNPNLKPSPSSFARGAEPDREAERQVRREHRDIQLRDAREANAAHVTLNDDSA